MSREAEDLNRRLLRARDAMDPAYAEPVDVRAVAAVARCSGGAQMFSGLRLARWGAPTTG